MGRVCLAILLAASCGAEDLLASLLAMAPEHRGPALQVRFLSPPRTWAADEAPVAEWLDRIGEGAHLVRIELGVDGRRQVALAAGSGRWWDQMRQLCEAGHLIPAPTRPVATAPQNPDDGEGLHVIMQGGQAMMMVTEPVVVPNGPPLDVAGGPLRLRQRETPNPLLLDGGEVLVEVSGRRLLGYHSSRREERILDCRLLVHLDPHAPWDLVASSRLVWDQLTADDGTVLQRLGPGSGDDRLRDALLPPPTDHALLRCASLPVGCRSITCSGRVELRCQGVVVLDQVLEPGAAQDLVVAPFPFSAQLAGRPRGPDGATHVLTLRYRCPEALENPAPLLSDAQGNQARIVDRSTSRDGDNALVVLDLVLPGDGPWRLHCELPIALPTVNVPVRCEVPLP